MMSPIVKLASASVLLLAWIACGATPEKALVVGSWHTSIPRSYIVMACKNPSFVETSNRMSQSGDIDEMHLNKQEGCGILSLPHQPVDVSKFKFKIVRTLNIDGNEIIEISQPLYLWEPNKVFYYNVFVRRQDIHSAPVHEPTLDELKALTPK